jgi:hypothetical protein
MGPWDALHGAELALASSTTDRGHVLAVRQPAASGGSTFRDGYLEKEIALEAKLRLSFAVQVTSGANGFGPDDLDYCDLAEILLDDDRVGTVYLVHSGASAFVYERAGSGSAPSWTKTSRRGSAST